jgi:hypothetical protein
MMSDLWKQAHKYCMADKKSIKLFAFESKLLILPQLQFIRQKKQFFLSQIISENN